MKIRNYISEVIILISLLILLIYSVEPIIHNDSNRYIDGSLIDPPIFHFLITIMLSLFESLISIVILQTLLVGFAIVFFTRTFSDIFNLNITNKIIISLFLFLPIIKFYNNILTETTGYALSLFLVSFVSKLIFNFSIKNLCWSTFFVIMLLLLRKQFVFLYPLILLLYLTIILLNKSKKKFLWISICILSILFVPLFFTSLNKYIIESSNDKKIYQDLDGYGPYYFTYIDSIYISNINDVNLFENQNVKETFYKIFENMDKQKMLSKYYDGRGHFGKSFASIRDNSTIPLLDLAAKENTTVNNLKKKISIKLISTNFDKYILLLFKKFYDSTWLFIFIAFFVFIAGLITFIKNKSHLSLLTIFISAFTLSNHSIVYLFGRVQPRYLIYSDFILIMYIFIIFCTFFHISNKVQK